MSGGTAGRSGGDRRLYGDHANELACSHSPGKVVPQRWCVPATRGERDARSARGTQGSQCGNGPPHPQNQSPRADCTMVCLGTKSIALADPWAIIWGKPCQLKRGADVPLLMLSVTAPTADHNSRRSSGLCPPTSFFLFTVLDGSSGRGGESSSLPRAACGEDERVAAVVCARR